MYVKSLSSELDQMEARGLLNFSAAIASVATHTDNDSLIFAPFAIGIIRCESFVENQQPCLKSGVPMNKREQLNK